MSLETVVRQVAKHLANQKVQAMANGYCAYRSENESGPINMCAVGCLLKEELFGPHLLMKDVDEIFESKRYIDEIRMSGSPQSHTTALAKLTKLDEVAVFLNTLVPEFSRRNAKRVFESIQFFHDQDATDGGFLHVVATHKGTDLELEENLYTQMMARIDMFELPRI